MAKSCFLVFAPQVLLLLTLSLFLPWGLLYSLRLPIIAINIVVSAFLGWRLYRNREHLVFTYDNSQLVLKKGTSQAETHTWAEFKRVSLARTEHGEFSVRLYKNDEDFFPIPASKLRLEPFTFRFEAMKLVSVAR